MATDSDKTYSYGEYLQTFFPNRPPPHDWHMWKIDGRTYHKCSRCGAVRERDSITCTGKKL